MGMDVVPMEAVLDGLADLRPQIAGGDPDGHGQEDPQSQEPVQDRKALHRAVPPPIVRSIPYNRLYGYSLAPFRHRWKTSLPLLRWPEAGRNERPDPNSGGEKMAEDTQQPAEQNPLHKKLGLRPGLNAAIVAAPDGDDNPLASPTRRSDCGRPGRRPDRRRRTVRLHPLLRPQPRRSDRAVRPSARQAGSRRQSLDLVDQAIVRPPRRRPARRPERERDPPDGPHRRPGGRQGGLARQRVVRAQAGLPQALSARRAGSGAHLRAEPATRRERVPTASCRYRSPFGLE